MAHSLPTYRNVAPSPRLSHARHTAATPRASESGHADCALLGPMTDVPFPAAGAARPRRLPEWTLNSLVALCGLALALPSPVACTPYSGPPTRVRERGVAAV